MTRKPAARPPARTDALLARLEAFGGYAERAVSLPAMTDADLAELVAAETVEVWPGGRYVRARAVA